MKKKSAAKSAFLNLRVLIGLPTVLAGAIMIAWGQAEGGSPPPTGKFSRFIQQLLPSPLVYGTTDVNLITGTEIFPNVTQSGTFTAGNPDNPLQIVVAYIDSRGRNATPITIGGASVSTDGGNTFVRLTAADGQSPFKRIGGPVVFYNRPSGTWFTVWLGGDCGDSGIGYYKSTTPWDPNSWTHGCIHAGRSDADSGWADNNPSSPFYGRMYVSWNNNFISGAIFVSYSTDNGFTWTNAQQIPSTNSIRNVQITGDLVTGDVYIAGMDDMGGAFTNRANKIYRSTDGGNTWALTYTGPTFPAPGRIGCSGYFPCMYPDNGGYWRTSGSGQPAAFNHVVHYVYASRNTGNGDPGNVFYIRSTDSGVTFSAPLQLNTDNTTRAQWQPSLSVAADGSVFATWYDERETASCTKGDPAVPCYRKWGRKSTDNGMSWLADQPFSDVISPLPDQVDPGIVRNYAGDNDYASSVLNQHLHAWVDGRVTIGGSSQQDVFFDRELVGCSVVSSSPPCGSVITGTAPTNFTVNLTEPVDLATLQASDLTVNGSPADNVTTLNGNLTIVFHFNSTPVTQGLNTVHIPAGAFNCGNGPVAEFTCTFTYQASTPTPTPSGTPTSTPVPTAPPRPGPGPSVTPHGTPPPRP